MKSESTLSPWTPTRQQVEIKKNCLLNKIIQEIYNSLNLTLESIKDVFYKSYLTFSYWLLKTTYKVCKK